MAKFNYEKAKKAGYSEAEITNFLSEREPKFNIEKAKKAGYSDKDINAFLSGKDHDERGIAEKTARVGAQYGLGLLDRAGAPLAIGSSALASEDAQHAELRKLVFEDIERLAEKKASGDWDDQDEQLFQYLQDQIKHPEQLREHVKTVDISPSGLVEEAVKKTGYDIAPQGGLEHGARLAGGLTPKEIGQIGKYGLKKVGKMFPERKAIPKGAATVEPEVLMQEIPKLEPKKFPSGLTQPKAVEAKYKELGILSPERQAQAIHKIDQEISSLAKEKVKKHHPIIQKIEEGFDFDGAFEKGFSELKQAASKANPTIDITELTNFLGKSRKDLGTLPSGLFTPEQKSVLKEIKLLRDQPQTSMKKLLELYRLNNKKLNAIYEKRLLHGKQKEYSDFLVGMNRAIAKSFENTLPEDSAWMKAFRTVNSTFSQFKKAQQTLNLLESVLNGRINSSNLNKLAFNPNLQKKLAIQMGKEGADEVAQLARDAIVARQSIKGMSARKIKEMDAIYPLGLFTPLLKIPAAGALLKKGIEYGRRAYGWYLTTPEMTHALDEAVKAIGKGDVEAYRAATSKLKAASPTNT